MKVVRGYEVVEEASLLEHDVSEQVGAGVGPLLHLDQLLHHALYRLVRPVVGVHRHLGNRNTSIT